MNQLERRRKNHDNMSEVKVGRSGNPLSYGRAQTNEDLPLQEVMEEIMANKNDPTVVKHPTSNLFMVDRQGLRLRYEAAARGVANYDSYDMSTINKKLKKMETDGIVRETQLNIFSYLK